MKNRMRKSPSDRFCFIRPYITEYSAPSIGTGSR